MAHRTVTTLVLAWLLSAPSAWRRCRRKRTLVRTAAGRVDAWYRRTAERTPRGMWGIVIARMDGTVLWSMNPDLELIPGLDGQGVHDRIRPRAHGRRRADHDPRGGLRRGRFGDRPLAGQLGAGAGRRPDAGPLRPGGSQAARAGPAPSRAAAFASWKDRSPSPAAPGPPIPASRRSGRPTTRGSSTPPRSGRSPCTRTRCRSPSGPGGKSVRLRRW